jgi:hypothetical protein
MIKKTIYCLLVAVILTIIPGMISLAETGRLELSTSRATLNIDRSGNIHITNIEGQIFEVNADATSLWKIVIKSNINQKEYVITPNNDLKIDKTENTIKIVVNNISPEGQSIPLNAEFSISVKDDAFCFSGSLKINSQDWIIKELSYPVFSEIKVNNDNVKVYWPYGVGQCFNDLSVFGRRSFDYPSVTGTMAWFSVNSSERGLYIGSHDPLLQAKTFSLGYEESDKLCSSGVKFPVWKNEFIIPDVIINLYNGSWHRASDFYRSWYDRNFKIAKVSDWAKKCEGYMLCILKQQNGDVMYTYKDIDKLCDVAEKLNFKLIGLWGRGVGGHDHLYPNYMPDNLLGGREEMRNAIERAHERGFKVIVYTNGKIIDTSTDFYEYNGIETIILNEKKQPLLEFWRKHENTTPRIFATACPGSSLWRRTMLNLAIDAKSLGADAFYIDQVGQGSPVTLMCYSEFHDHQTPQEAYSEYRIKMMHDIRGKMKEMDPEFSIMTEGLNDALLSDVDFFQGVPNLNTPFLFPEMFRYTFPEVISVTVNPSPALNRTDANYSTVYGLRQQIMSRYPADVDYLLNNKIPEYSDYANITGPPDIKRFTQASAEETTKYTHDLFQFQNDNAEFFRFGKFIDEEGIEIAGDDILAKGFENGKRIGVIVWNRNLTEERNFSISLPGYRLISACEPHQKKISSSSPLKANSLRLLIFEKLIKTDKI